MPISQPTDRYDPLQANTDVYIARSKFVKALPSSRNKSSFSQSLTSYSLVFQPSIDSRSPAHHSTISQTLTADVYICVFEIIQQKSITWARATVEANLIFLMIFS